MTVAYDGTNYCGWQVQPNGLAVQEVLNRCLSEFLGTETEVIGASRTDAGVHALGNVAVFDTEARMPAEKFSYALNTRLPQDIRIQDSCQVPEDFHPRFQETIKTYEYKIYNRQFPDPTKRLYTYFYYYPLDVQKMRQGAGYLIGEHDFKSFSTYKPEVENTVRTIYELDIHRSEDNVITIRIRGNGFLYNMVRIIAGPDPCRWGLLSAGTCQRDSGRKKQRACRRDRAAGRADSDRNPVSGMGGEKRWTSRISGSAPAERRLRFRLTGTDR